MQTVLLKIKGPVYCSICSAHVTTNVDWTFTSDPESDYYLYYRYFNKNCYLLCSPQCIAKFNLTPLLAKPLIGKIH